MGELYIMNWIKNPASTSHEVYDNTDAYISSSWEDVYPEMTVPSVRGRI